MSCPSSAAAPRRRPRARPLLAPALVLAACAAPSSAFAATAAERTAQAEALFQEAVKLIDAGRAQEACPKLEESDRLEAGLGTSFRLADCYERIGRTASAWSGFTALAARVKNPDQVRKARARADALEPNLARLLIAVPAALSALAGLEIRRDGARIGKAEWGAAVPVDPGTHTVRATADGWISWEASVDASKPGATVTVTVPPLAPVATSLPGQRVAALVVGGLGLAAIAAGSALGAVAGSTWSDATSRCPGRVDCTVQAHDLSVRALSLSTGSTIAFVGGAAALAGGAILWLVSPSRPAPRVALWAAPVIGGGAHGAVLGGSF